MKEKYEKELQEMSQSRGKKARSPVISLASC
jgi:hypothetical protein